MSKTLQTIKRALELISETKLSLYNSTAEKGQLKDLSANENMTIDQQIKGAKKLQDIASDYHKRGGEWAKYAHTVAVNSQAMHRQAVSRLKNRHKEYKQ